MRKRSRKRTNGEGIAVEEMSYPLIRFPTQMEESQSELGAFDPPRPLQTPSSTASAAETMI